MSDCSGYSDKYFSESDKVKIVPEVDRKCQWCKEPKSKHTAEQWVMCFDLLQESLNPRKNNRPDVPHYNTTKIQVVDVVADWFPVWQEDTWNCANVLKYIRRFRLKGTPLHDLQKARDYIDFLIEKYEE